MSKFIQSAWTSYRKMVVPPDAPPIQIQECKQAFFAGAATLFNCLLNGFDSSDDITKSDLQSMADIQSEIDDFGQQIDRRYFGDKEH